MILDLGQFGGFLETTASFSNSVVVAMLPYVAEVAKQLEVPLPQPITQQQMLGGGPSPIFETRRGEMMGCGFRLKGGWIFGFQEGHLAHFETPHSFYMRQNPDEIPELVGTVRMSQDAAVQMARDTLTKLGFPLEAVFAEQEPHVRMPPKTRTGVVPHYLIKWLSPWSSSDPQSWSESVEIEINADAKRVEYLKLESNPNLRRPWPEFGVAPVLRGKKLAANPEYAWRLLPIVLRAVDEYGKSLALPIPRPLITNQVARFSVADNGGWPHAELELTNGWRFVYRNRMVNGYYAPDALFDFQRRPVLIRDLAGKRNVSEADATKLIRRALAKLNYAPELVHMDFDPHVIKPAVAGIPRCWFSWNLQNEQKNDLVSKVEAEVDLHSGALKSLYFDNKALWNHPPLIDVPIAPPRTNIAGVASPTKSQGRSAAARPPPTRYKTPVQR